MTKLFAPHYSSISFIPSISSIPFSNANVQIKVFDVRGNAILKTLSV